MTRSTSDPLTIEPAAGHERAAALALVFAHLEPADRDRRVSEALSERNVDAAASDVWVARRGEPIVGAMRTAIQPGRTAFVSPPRLVSSEPLSTARELASDVVRYLERQGVRLAQALLETDHGTDLEALGASGFRHVSDLLYLVSQQASFPTDEPAETLEFVPYSPAEHDRLAGIVERTYEGSLDCPAVDRVRDIEDVLAGYRATGVFDPRRWLIVAHDKSDVGCLLMTDHPKSQQWELMYMGVVSEARGRGWGVAIVRHAQWIARQARRQRVVLAVDAANAPAIAVYAACGFVTWDHRSVLVRVF